MNNNNYNAAYELLANKPEEVLNKTAFVDDYESIKYSQLIKKVQSFSYSLLNSGIQKNDRILICMYDSINYPICFLGAIWSGIIPICINTMLPKKDLKYMLDDSNARGVICSEELLNIFIDLNKGKRKHILFSDYKEKDSYYGNKVTSIKSMIKNKVYQSFPSKTQRNSECFWLYSSGSTGKPKGTIHVHESLLNTADLYAKKILKIKKNDIFFSAAKLFFAYGLGNALTFPLSIGGTSILTKERPTESLIIKMLQKHNVTLFFGVPTLYAAILNTKINFKNFKSLRLAVSAGEALPEHLCKKWENLSGKQILDGIGSTEMLHIFISNKIDDIYPGSSGKLVEGYEARIIKDDNTEADFNEIGELEIKGPTAAIGYWNKPEKTKATFIKKWTKTGDKYTRNSLGVYTYCGRTDDMMKVSGQYVSPFEIEAALQSHPAVLEAAVVGKFNDDNLLKPKAYIVLNKNININHRKLETELTNHIKKVLTPFKYPRWYKFLSALPKTATGKIQRYKLRSNEDL